MLHVPLWVELDGHRVGDGTGWVITKATELGDFESRPADTAPPFGDGVLLGRDSVGAAQWTFALATNLSNHTEALAAARELARVWRESANSDPGTTTVLRVGFGDRTIRVYGRARRVSLPRPDVLTIQGNAQVLAQFTVTDPVVYDDQDSSLELRLVGGAAGGASWPVTWPVEWDRVSSARQGVVRVEGDAPVPFLLTVHGPVAGAASQIALAGPGWWLEFPSLALAFDQVLVVDTAAMTATVGGVFAGALSRRSRLGSRLVPGDQEITFSAADPTATARAVISWRPGAYSL